MKTGARTKTPSGLTSFDEVRILTGGGDGNTVGLMAQNIFILGGAKQWKEANQEAEKVGFHAIGILNGMRNLLRIKGMDVIV